MKQKKCKHCKRLFTPIRPMQTTCSYACAIEYAKTLSERKKLSEKRERKRAIKDINDIDKVVLRQKAQSIVNKYARLRDEYEFGRRCCTCGSTFGKMDGGHFLPTSSYSAIRYNSNQIHQQCVKCNRFNGGMPREYRSFMIEKYGVEYVEKLESFKGVTRRYSAEYLSKLIKVFSRKIKILVNKKEIIEILSKKNGGLSGAI